MRLHFLHIIVMLKKEVITCLNSFLQPDENVLRFMRKSSQKIWSFRGNNIDTRKSYRQKDFSLEK